MKTLYPYGTIEIENPKNGYVFKVNGKWLKNSLEFS